MQLAPHTPWQRVLCPNAGSNTPLYAVAKGGATHCSPNSALQEAVGRAHGVSRVRIGVQPALGTCGVGEVGGGSLADLPAREHPLGCDVWGTMQLLGLAETATAAWSGRHHHFW